MSTFENPSAFLLLLAVPLYYVLKQMKIISKPVFPLPFEDWHGQGFDWKSGVSSIVRIISRVSFITGYVAMVAALADPTVIHQERSYTSRSSEVVFVIDVSPSMAAMDISTGTRLDAAKKAIQLLVNNNKGAAYGLVSFASESALLVPPTMDHNTLFTRLNEMQIGELGDQTALGLGISSAVYHLVSTYAPRKSIVLLTDGENNAGAVHPETAAKLAKDYGIALYVAGIGTKGSVPIEYVDPSTGQKYSGYLDSSFDHSSLRTIAKITEGNYFTVETLSSLSEALQTINTENAVSQSYHIKQIEENLYSVMLLISIGLFAFAWILRRVFLREVV